MGQTYSAQSLPYTTCLPGGDDYVILKSKYSEKQITSADGYGVSRLLFEESCKKYASKRFLGTREQLPDGTVGPYKWKTYQEVYDIVEDLASGLEHINACPIRTFDDEVFTKNVACLGISSRNRAEYLMAIEAAYRQNYTFVPLYDTLGGDVIEFIINQTQMATVIAEEKKVKDILNVASQCPSLKNIISIDNTKLDESLVEICTKNNIKFYTINDIIEMGKKNHAPKKKSTENDINTICYTSGTTGTPKGAILTQANFSATIKALDDVLRKNEIDLSNNDCHISYLPYAHIFERAITEAMIMNGVQIGYYRGDTQKIVDDVKELKPTLFFSVPRLFNRIYDKITEQITNLNMFKRALFELAYRSKLSKLKSTGDPTHAFWDNKIFKNFKNALGGRVRILFSGSAPINAQILEFLKIAFCCPFLEGYGMTETVCAGTITYYADYNIGHVGGLIGSIEAKVVNIPDMGYSIKDKDDNNNITPRGELCIKGPSVFKGYFRNKEKTEESIKDGYFHTGDVCQVLANGSIKIIDRAKNIFKLSQGEYIAPEKIEGIYNQVNSVSQVFVFGYSSRRSLVAIVVPNWTEYVKDVWCVKNNVEYDMNKLCNDVNLKNDIMNGLKDISKKNGLCSFEQAKDISLITEPFSVENDLLTPSFKLKRHVAKDRYKDLIDGMYIALNDTD